MRHRYRGTRTGCRMRITLPKPAEHYRKPRRCYCGGRLAVDRYRHAHEVGAASRAAQRVCGCDGYPFPHRTGSLWCIHHSTGPDADAMRARYGPGCFEEIRS